MALEPAGAKTPSFWHTACARGWSVFGFLSVMRLYEVSDCTNLLFLERLLNLLQVGEQADVRADLQAEG